jgi:hypothetical protein
MRHAGLFFVFIVDSKVAVSSFRFTVLHDVMLHDPRIADVGFSLLVCGVCYLMWCASYSIAYWTFDWVLGSAWAFLFAGKLYSFNGFSCSQLVRLLYLSGRICFLRPVIRQMLV